MLTQAEGASLVLIGGMALHGPQLAENRPRWYTPVGVLSFSVSLAVNAIFTGLLVFKIAKSSLALQHTHARRIQDFTRVVSMLIESGLALFVGQMIWIICFSVESHAFALTGGSITMIYVRCLFTHLPLFIF